MTRDDVLEIICGADDESQIEAWNAYCDDNNDPGSEIRRNDSETYGLFFGDDTDEAIRATQYGEFHYCDDWCVLNAYGNLDSFDRPDDDHSPFDADTLADWIMDDTDRLEEWFGTEFEEDEEDEDDDDNETEED